MTRRQASAIALITAGAVVACSLAVDAQQPAASRYWPQWRGPHATGVSTTANPPIEWSETKNIKLEGRDSRPRIGVAGRLGRSRVRADGGAGRRRRRGAARAARRRQPRGVHHFMVLAIDRKTGKTRLGARRRASRSRTKASHPDNGTWASSSPITDGERVFAYFESFGLYAYDMNGTLVWQKDLGDKQMRNQFGEGIDAGALRQHASSSSGITSAASRSSSRSTSGRPRALARAARRRSTPGRRRWSSRSNGRAQVIVPAMKRVRSYDLETGKVVWESDGLTMNAIPSPVYGDGLVFLMSGFRGNDLKAIRVADAKGDIDGTHAIAWTLDRDTPYVPSPLLVRRRALLPEDQQRDPVGVRRQDRQAALSESAARRRAQCVRVAGGGRRGASTSPAAKARRWSSSPGPTTRCSREEQLDDGFDASPALVDNEIFLRGYKYLYAIAQP